MMNDPVLQLSRSDLVLQKRSSLSPKATSKLKFGTVGNFVPVREQSSLCRFLKLLKDRGVDFDFFFVGARSEKEPWQYDDCVQYCQNNGLRLCPFPRFTQRRTAAIGKLGCIRIFYRPRHLRHSRNRSHSIGVAYIRKRLGSDAGNNPKRYAGNILTDTTPCFSHITTS